MTISASTQAVYEGVMVLVADFVCKVLRDTHPTRYLLCTTARPR